MLEYIQAQLVAKYNCERVRVPLADEPGGSLDEPQSYIYIRCTACRRGDWRATVELTLRWRAFPAALAQS